MKKPLKWVAARLGQAIETETVVTGWSIDSRTLRPGDLFFALRGPTHDGHAYVAEVLRKGAAGAVVDRPVDGPVLRVEDSLAALQAVAAAARLEWAGQVVGVTGSAGKTTTKDVIAEMLSVGLKTAKTEGNLNNHFGLPLSLLRVEDQAQAAVLEMGMNHAGEIRALAEIARPNVGVVTNVGYAHMENFDSIDGIAAAKRELIEALPPNGTAVLNADDRRVAAFAQVHAGPVVTYGEVPGATVRAEDVRFSEEGLAFRVGQVRFESSLTGRHSVSNLLAGIAVAGIFGIAPERLTERVRKIQPGKMRGQRFRHRGILVFDDCYNSNPDAARAMLSVLRDTPARRRIAVLGEMLELGRWAEPLHREVGNYAAECGIDVLVGLRGAACYMLDAAKRSGLRADAAFFFDDPVPAGQLVRSLAQAGDAVLFKGSRGVHVELALEQFLASQEAGGS
ncbi:MAG TPA: UDP-N-acetylmuramoyl-tripeptide--D-alanyl-D-alanine ligase [Bryobacteraceae bacterium]|nr:UDP-N-acetylmuramoyl-tripeptide--D-alanyl-D-alanine ligase [Bryobacteraceae bacterium]